MPARHDEQPDQRRIVASLAAECHVPIREMATLYEHERAELALGAHVTKFVHIFATRNVLDILRERGIEWHASRGLPSLHCSPSDAA
jgi:hypothetical protein